METESGAAVGELAGLGRRIAAFVVDLLGFAVVLAVCVLPGVLLLEGAEPGLVLALFGLFVLVVITGFFGYRIAFETTLGYTVGKRLLGIRVVDETGGDIGWIDAAIRNVVLIAENLPFAYLLAVAVIAYDDDQRRLGDMAAKTYVVRI